EWVEPGSGTGLDSSEIMIIIRDTTYADSALTGVIIRDTANLLYEPINGGVDSSDVMTIIRDTTYLDSTLTGVIIRDTADLLYEPLGAISDSLELALRLEDTAAYALTILASPVVTTAITVPDNSISDEELDEGGSFTWTAVHDFGGATSVEIPNSDNPTTNANGQIAQDNNANAFEVYIPSESESGLVPFYRDYDKTIIAPGDINDEVSLFRVDALLYPHGIEIDKVSILLDADLAYSMVFEEWSSADPPVYVSTISTVTTGATDTYAEEAPDTDAAIAAGNRIYLDIPATAPAWLALKIIYHVTEGN
ncbi:MAG: hypothetical protein KAS32_21630, partial [Candidatus Peribacteraceae bacterium]|nr:hypothetical protein [Candidatus Peribacteraceae bacterium]